VQTLAGAPVRGLRTWMIVVIPRTWPLRKGEAPEPEDSEWLPRTCPACSVRAVIGHGRRSKQAHDSHHSRIRYRRGLCQHCGKTVTVLPAWSLPYAHYSLAARQEAVEGYAEDGATLETAAPLLRDADRVADASTLRRWFQRRLASWLTCLLHAPLLAPTILAWDWRASFRMLIPEPEPI
jgi:hypothetical protein